VPLRYLAGEQFCYLTTTGRRTGKPHTIEIWFALDQSTLFLLSGGGEDSDWVKNLQWEPAVSVRIGLLEVLGRARTKLSPDEDERARRLLLEKYGPTYEGDLTRWGRESLAVAVDLDEPD
jgi:deazaflavin-dependent oxidoreductase (nitroreductase family)